MCAIQVLVELEKLEKLSTNYAYELKYLSKRIRQDFWIPGVNSEKLAYFLNKVTTVFAWISDIVGMDTFYSLDTVIEYVKIIAKYSIFYNPLLDADYFNQLICDIQLESAAALIEPQWKNVHESEDGYKCFLEIFDDIISKCIDFYKDKFFHELNDNDILCRVVEGAGHKSERFIPWPSKTNNRWNPKGKQYLYLSFNERNVVDCITSIRFLKSLGIAVYFEKERINTLEARNERIIAVWAAVAQEEAVNTSKNAHWASVKRFQNGTFELSKMVYGYQKNEHGELIIDEAQAAVVKAIAADYLNGMGTLSIAQKLNQNGIPAPNQGRWFDSTVRRILQNEKIAGDFLMQKTIANGNVPFKREINRGQAPKYLIKEDHEGILTREEQARIEWIMNSRRSIRNHHVWEGREESNVLHGKLICAECGSVLGRERGRPTGRYKGTVWRGPTHHKQSERCSLKPIKEEQIQQAFIDLYHKMKQCQEIILKPFINHLKEIPVSEHVRRNLEEMDYQCTELYMQSQVLLKIKAEGYVDMDFFMEKDRSIRQEIKDIRSRQGEIRKSIDNTSQWKTIEHLLDCLNIHIGRMEQFDAYLFSNMVETVKVKSQT